MDTVAAFRSPFSTLSHDWQNQVDLSRLGSKPLLAKAWFQHKPLVSRGPLGNRKIGLVSRKSPAIRASFQSSDSGSSSAQIAPLQLESPIGQFLSQILVSHPHLVPAAVEQQLEQLQTDRNAEEEKEEPSASGIELVLYRRITEVKANERRKASEEILYTLVVQKFMDADVPLVPTIAPESSGRANTWRRQQEKLADLHSPEAYEMIQNHLTLILGNRIAETNLIAQISKLRVRQVYAASVMYGYFLKRVDQRFQLEKTMKIFPEGIDNEDSYSQHVKAEERRSSAEGRNTHEMHPEVSSWSGSVGGESFSAIKPSRLRSYVMSFDGETLQRYAPIRSKEAASIIEKHTEALFGRPEIVITPQGIVDSSKDENMSISFDGMSRLVLEAVTFGAFLWDVESYVDSRYHFVAN